MLRSNLQNSPEILIIDENQSLSTLLARLLSSRGYNLTISNTLADSISALKNKRHNLVLLDPTFRDRTKEETLTEFQNHDFLKNHRIVIFSGTCEPEFVEKWRSRGLYSHLDKPATIDNIVDFLKKESMNTEIRDVYDNNETETLPEEPQQTNDLPPIREPKSEPDVSNDSSNARTHPDLLEKQRKENISTLRRSYDELSTNKLNNIISNLISAKNALKTKADDANLSNAAESEKKEIETELHKLMSELSNIKNEIQSESPNPRKINKKRESKTKFKKIKRKSPNRNRRKNPR